MAQLEDYDESFFLAKCILELRPSIFAQVFAQRPATLLEAKGIVEDLELTQSMVAMHQIPQKKMIKVAQHRGTQERRSGRLHQSVEDGGQKKT